MAFYRKDIGGLHQVARIAKARLHRARALMREYLTR
ncbi:hypothetical protein AB7M17_005615 [Bradyrhizobium sp. USDA 377]